MRILSGRLVPLVSLCGAIVVYALGMGLAAVVCGYGLHKVASVVAAEFAPAAKAPVARVAAGDTRRASASSVATTERRVVREAMMTLTQDRWSRSYGRRDLPYGYGAQFGSSTKGGYRPRGFFDRFFDWDGAWSRPADTYRTVCVRLCDGYYFPISFSVTEDSFQRDRGACESRCGTQARLFVYRNPGDQLEDMQDLQGRPYRKLATAFLYRTEYVADCKCRPHPWEDQAKNQHRAYALAAAKRKGDKAAAAELAALEAEMRRPSRPSARTAGLSAPPSDFRALPGVAGSDQRMSRKASEADLMRLGAEKRKAPVSQPDTRPRPYTRDDGWARRSFWRDF